MAEAAADVSTEVGGGGGLAEAGVTGYGLGPMTTSGGTGDGVRGGEFRTDWRVWRPKEVANLCFVVEAERVLLIRKKRGLGAGKVNAPGGKLEPGETPEAAAVREAQEELGVTPFGLRAMGQLFFQFTDGYGLQCHVFRAEGCEGEPVETGEAVPLWTPLDRVPYGEMWADDALWLPRLLEGKTFIGWFEFDGEEMLGHRLDYFISPVMLNPDQPWLEF
jgi:8-oxo-dGTP diphosphatase